MIVMTTSRNAARVVLAVVPLLALLGCGSDHPTSLTAPAPAPAPSTTPSGVILVNSANWTANATVTGAEGGRACGWGTSVGETRAEVQWQVGLNGDSVWLDEDMHNWPTDDIPFAGRLNGVEFVATYTSNADYAKYVCPFREATLTGRFDATFSRFDADETLVWGTPGAETIVHRRWIGSRVR